MTTEAPVAPAASAGMVELPVDQIFIAKERKRRSLDHANEKDVHFIEGIRREGVRNPIEVRPAIHGQKPYELITGQRRYGAARFLGLSTIPVRVLDISDTQMDYFIVTENTLRRQMTDAEYIKAVQKMLREMERVFGADPGRRNSASAAGRGNGGKFARAADEVAVFPRDGNTEVEPDEGSIPSVEEAGKKEVAPKTHSQIYQDTTGRGTASAYNDIALAKAFSTDDLDLLGVHDIIRADMVRLSKLDESPRKRALTLIACGETVDRAIAVAMADAKAAEEAKKGPPKPPKEDDLSDTEWLMSWCKTSRQYIENPQFFDKDALAYRRIRDNLAAFRAAERDRIVGPRKEGWTPFIGLIYNAMYVEHPDKWHVCGECAGRNKEVPDCEKCGGKGYRLTFFEPRKR